MRFLSVRFLAPFMRGNAMEEAPTANLTCRELGVLRLLARGLSNRLIARRLEISEKTVKNHLTGIYPKIGATDRTQAALYAHRVGLTELCKGAPPAASANAEPPADPTLTARERGVLRLLARGLSNRLIARRLEISEKTVKNHLTGIYPKIGATDRTQAALYAHRVGLAA
ncbi:response regulator transcription factor [Streptomyces sp. NBC_01190]|uniref:response regulator transcription factor n=1 Tax=Streptomyces sp. NBC_01190 TaxID=2903767 RepID=UPI0038693CCC|nr:response regulator transcription factor [Streptomyces sp. NBC_01190]